MPPACALAVAHPCVVAAPAPVPLPAALLARSLCGERCRWGFPVGAARAAAPAPLFCCAALGAAALLFVGASALFFVSAPATRPPGPLPCWSSLLGCPPWCAGPRPAPLGVCPSGGAAALRGRALSGPRGRASRLAPVGSLAAPLAPWWSGGLPPPLAGGGLCAPPLRAARSLRGLSPPPSRSAPGGCCAPFRGVCAPAAPRAPVGLWALRASPLALRAWGYGGEGGRALCAL